MPGSLPWLGVAAGGTGRPAALRAGLPGWPGCCDSGAEPQPLRERGWRWSEQRWARWGDAKLGKEVTERWDRKFAGGRGRHREERVWVEAPPEAWT